MSADLVQLIRSKSFPLEPEATGVEPDLPGIPEIRALVFDVYGTLFISGSGDISLAKAENRSPALAESIREAGWSLDGPEADLSERFHTTLERFREKRRSEGISWPEVRIEEVWETFIGELESDHRLSGSGCLKRAVVAFECRVNPCWPMPGLRELLAEIRRKELPMGIVSNAQFYTPLLFEALSGSDLAGHGFAPDLCVWSYRERIGKPDTKLYRVLVRQLESLSIAPSSVLYVGNDIRNDIWPAGKSGFRTALFAGDKRSLRMRKDDPDCRTVRPDVTLTHLTQILEVIR